MSVAHVGWAFQQQVGSPTQKLVLVALADRINKDTLICRPLIKDLAIDCCLSERAARQALKDLCDSGVIGRERRRRSDGSLSGYDFVFPQIRISAQPAAPPAASPAASPAGQEPEVVLEPEEVLSAAPQNSNGNGSTERVRNEKWDALSEIFGEPTTRPSMRERGQVCRDLTEAGATADEIFRRAKRWALHFDHATLTDHALVKHWDTLARKPLRRQ